jgi:hypothetical protein
VQADQLMDRDPIFCHRGHMATLDQHVRPLETCTWVAIRRCHRRRRQGHVGHTAGCAELHVRVPATRNAATPQAMTALVQR